MTTNIIKQPTFIHAFHASIRVKYFRKEHKTNITFMPSMMLVNITITWMFSCQTIAQWSATVFGLGPGFVKKKLYQKLRLVFTKKLFYMHFCIFFFNRNMSVYTFLKSSQCDVNTFERDEKSNQSIKGTKIMTSYLEQRCRLSHFSYSTNEVINLLLHDMPEIRIYHSFLTKSLQCTCIRIRIA